MEASASTPLMGRLLDMKQRFVRTMPARIADITTTLSGYGDGTGEVRATLERQFHTLAGTAGTYDLDAVAAAAFEGEQACVELENSPPHGGDFMYLEFLVEQLHGALNVDSARQSNTAVSFGGSRA